MKINTLSGPCGSGKTQHQVEKIVSQPGFYLWAAPTVKVLNETEARIRKAAGDAPVIIEKVISARSTGGSSINVRNDLESLSRRFPEGHIIVLATHAGFFNAETRSLGEWNAIIDEVPDVLTTENLENRALGSWLAENFELVRVNPSSDWCRVELKSDLKRTQIAHDDLLKTLLQFYDRVTNPRCEVLTTLSDFLLLKKVGQRWSYHCIWDFELLQPFESVTVIGNDLRNSVFGQFAMKNEIELVEQPLKVARQFKQRKATVHFFTRSHRASSYLFKSRPEGRDNLAKVGEHLRSVMPASQSIWTANEGVTGFIGDVPGTYLTPKQHGSNEYADRTHAAIIFTAKPSPVEIQFCALHGIDADVLIQQRERETIVQFACRTAIRDPQSTADLHFYVYDAQQADSLCAYLRSLDYVTVEAKLISTGFEHQTFVYRKQDDADAVKLAKREAERARKQAQRDRARAGLPPAKRGRPRTATQPSLVETDTPV